MVNPNNNKGGKTPQNTKKKYNDPSSASPALTRNTSKLKGTANENTPGADIPTSGFTNTNEENNRNNDSNMASKVRDEGYKEVVSGTPRKQAQINNDNKQTNKNDYKTNNPFYIPESDSQSSADNKTGSDNIKSKSDNNNNPTEEDNKSTTVTIVNKVDNNKGGGKKESNRIGPKLSKNEKMIRREQSRKTAAEERKQQDRRSKSPGRQISIMEATPRTNNSKQVLLVDKNPNVLEDDDISLQKRTEQAKAESLHTAPPETVNVNESIQDCASSLGAVLDEEKAAFDDMHKKVPSTIGTTKKKDDNEDDMGLKALQALIAQNASQIAENNKQLTENNKQLKELMTKSEMTDTTVNELTSDITRIQDQVNKVDEITIKQDSTLSTLTDKDRQQTAIIEKLEGRMENLVTEVEELKKSQSVEEQEILLERESYQKLATEVEGLKKKTQLVLNTSSTKTYVVPHRQTAVDTTENVEVQQNETNEVQQCSKGQSVGFHGHTSHSSLSNTQNHVTDQPTSDQTTSNNGQDPEDDPQDDGEESEEKDEGSVEDGGDGVDGGDSSSNTPGESLPENSDERHGTTNGEMKMKNEPPIGPEGSDNKLPHVQWINDTFYGHTRQVISAEQLQSLNMESILSGIQDNEFKVKVMVSDYTKPLTQGLSSFHRKRFLEDMARTLQDSTVHNTMKYQASIRNLQGQLNDIFVGDQITFPDSDMVARVHATQHTMSSGKNDTDESNNNKEKTSRREESEYPDERDNEFSEEEEGNRTYSDRPSVQRSMHRGRKQQLSNGLSVVTKTFSFGKKETVGSPISTPKYTTAADAAYEKGVDPLDIQSMADVDYHMGELGKEKLTGQDLRKCGITREMMYECPDAEVIELHRMIMSKWENWKGIEGPDETTLKEATAEYLPTLLNVYSKKDTVGWFDELQEKIAPKLIAIMPFDATDSTQGYEALCPPGFGTERYTKMARTLYKIIFDLIPNTADTREIKRDVSTETMNGYQALYKILCMGLPGFNEALELKRPHWEAGRDNLEDYYDKWHLHLRLAMKTPNTLNFRNIVFGFLNGIKDTQYLSAISTVKTNISAFQPSEVPRGRNKATYLPPHLRIKSIYKQLKDGAKGNTHPIIPGSSARMNMTRTEEEYDEMLEEEFEDLELEEEMTEAQINYTRGRRSFNERRSSYPRRYDANRRNNQGNGDRRGRFDRERERRPRDESRSRNYRDESRSRQSEIREPNPDGGTRYNENVTCHGCGQKGHIRKDCPIVALALYVETMMKGISPDKRDEFIKRWMRKYRIEPEIKPRVQMLKEIGVANPETFDWSRDVTDAVQEGIDKLADEVDWSAWPAESQE